MNKVSVCALPPLRANSVQVCITAFRLQPSNSKACHSTAAVRVMGLLQIGRELVSICPCDEISTPALLAWKASVSDRFLRVAFASGRRPNPDSARKQCRLLHTACTLLFWQLWLRLLIRLVGFHPGQNDSNHALRCLAPPHILGAAAQPRLSPQPAGPTSP